MKQLTTSSLKQGYITIPRALLNRQATDGAAGETEAFLQILAHTNYSDVPYDINGTTTGQRRHYRPHPSSGKDTPYPYHQL